MFARVMISLTMEDAMTDKEILERMGRDIMALTKERDKYKADADKLADVCRILKDRLAVYEAGSEEIIVARAALKAHEDLDGRA